jgi:hypothetical protein
MLLPAETHQPNDSAIGQSVYGCLDDLLHHSDHAAIYCGLRLQCKLSPLEAG